MSFGNDPIEPSAEIRTFAHTLREMYVALTAEGFTHQQAIAIIGQALAAQSGGSEA